MTDNDPEALEPLLRTMVQMNPRAAHAMAMRMLAANMLEVTADLRAIADPDAPEAREALIAALLDLPIEVLNTLLVALRDLHARLMDANSAFPATREFLRARGLTHVNQLDAEGLQELKAHLEDLLRELSKNSAQ